MNEILEEQIENEESEVSRKIRAEIKAIIAKIDIAGERRKERIGLSCYLDNFYMFLPAIKYGADYLIQRATLFSGDLKVVEKLRNERFIDLHQKNGENMEADLISQGYSKKYIYMNKIDFAEEISSAIAEAGIDKNEIGKYIDDCLDRGVGVMNDTEKVKDLVLPVFIKLREKGYTHKDLTVF